MKKILTGLALMLSFNTYANTDDHKMYQFCTLTVDLEVEIISLRLQGYKANHLKFVLGTRYSGDLLNHLSNSVDKVYDLKINELNSNNYRTEGYLDCYDKFASTGI